MQLDFLTLLATTAISLFMISASLPLIMGRNISASARYVQASLLLQALAWAAIIASTYVPATLADRILSTVSIGCGSAAQWMNYRALAGWLGPRPWPRLLLVLVVATPLGYFLSFGSYAIRVGWANTLLAAVTLLVARATLQPQRPAETGWRRLIFVSMLTMAGLTLARGIVGAFTDQYPSFRTPHPVNLAFALGACVTVVLNTIAMLVAWRDEAEIKLRELAVTDALTSLPNRRGFEKRAQAMLAHARRHDLPLTALMLDLDHFKQVNDTHGHMRWATALCNCSAACSRKRAATATWPRAWAARSSAYCCTATHRPARRSTSGCASACGRRPLPNWAWRSISALAWPCCGLMTPAFSHCWHGPTGHSTRPRPTGAAACTVRPKML
ncbi:diguanylate cyclase (GGDEF)-like protein [Acidovorax temperans]|uniref:diguanylate cyclase n=1 Tax=Acidovorax temperans TaxID=80878 RepID=A0A543LMI3_9BURK|nr:diguanylate cyclase (GGDEF)-like protein [Acidovorax temperans]